MLKLRNSISTRLVLWFALILSVIFLWILVVIEQREVRILFDGTRSQTLLLARYMADVNLQPLVRYDQEAIQINIESRVNSELPYIIFYNRSGEPLAANTEIKEEKDVYCCTRLPENAEEGDWATENRTVKWKGTDVRVLEVEIPVFLPGGVRKWASVKIGNSLEPVYREIARIRRVLILIGFGGLFFGILAVALLAKGITGPLKRLVDGTMVISRGDFSQRIIVESRDEVGDLAKSFNEMTARLLESREKVQAANLKLLQSEKLASIGRLSATIAHEIRNPLTSVKLNVQKLAEFTGLTQAEHEHLDLSIEGIAQIEKFIKQMLDYTRVSELNLEEFGIEQVLDESLKVIDGKLKEREIVVEKIYAPGLPLVRVDAEKLRQVFLNLLRNAEEALPRGGRIVITTGIVDEGGVSQMRICFADNGPGIREKDRANIFEPFYSTKASGFGLGLAIARKILEQHGGTIKASGGDPGTVFTVLLPIKGDA